MPPKTPLGKRPVGTAWDPKGDPAHGRRLRAIAALTNGTERRVHVGAQTLIAGLRRSLTHLEALRALDRSRNLAEARQWRDDLPLRVHAIPAEVARTLDAVPEDYKDKRDPELHPGLQDLAYQITWDIHEACAAISDPNIYFAGVDEGIEPVTNEHIQLAIWGMQRELLRELRGPAGPAGMRRPAVQLNELPEHIQRALVERRRLRYQQWGIGQAEWEANRWSVWSIPEDPDWAPPWVPAD